MFMLLNTASQWLMLLMLYCVSTHLHSGLGPPGKSQLVGQYSCRDRGSVVAPPAHQHHTQLGNMPLCAKSQLGSAGSHLCPV